MSLFYESELKLGLQLVKELNRRILTPPTRLILADLSSNCKADYNASMLNWLVNFLWPKMCVGCGKWDAYICDKCEMGREEEEQICPVCARGSRYGKRHKYCHKAWGMAGLSCLWKYEGITKKLIAGAKYQFYYDQLKWLSEDSLRLIERPEFAKLREFLQNKPTVVPVPLSAKRLKERGFNQAEIVAKIVASRQSLVFGEILEKTRDTEQQVGKSREERLKNLKGVFGLKTSRRPEEDHRLKTVLLVDDVWTTGATLSECAQVLRKSGVKKVWGLVLAR